ncbi:MAG: aminoacyl-tRNA hydrolase [Microthrixaceae bacterium]|nr:aminoacyl-tRNA hydrolase [Microthrixaceae bacterium]MCB1011198.1 aminoacyl-tRNA hydrolase [Microthrixaceae bacterium]MCB9387293.1 aminoacyl-tRNA hydrolase [Microthrixaceae bacterium]MCO5322883.1 aminoacyl-tRNA hydrolase [Microthrixaceae bacterium]
MADDLEIRPGLVISAAELSERFMPSGGPGGQHANRSNTRVELRFDAAGSTSLSERQRERVVERLGAEVRVVVDEERSQARNRDIARQRLGARIASALVRETPRRPTKPSRGAKRRRLQDKKRRSELKQQRRRPEM